MMKYILCIAIVLGSAYPALAATYYRTNIACANPTYSIALNNCTGSDGRSFTSDSAARAVMVAGDILQYRAAGSPYNERLNNGSLSGTASARITFENFPGESVTLTYTGSSYPLYMAGNYITYRGLTINAGSATGQLSNYVSGNNLTIENMTITDNWGAAIRVAGGSNIVIRNNRLLKSGVAGNCVPGNSSITYGIYLSHTSGTGGVVIEGNEIADNTGAGIHVYPGPNKGVVVRNNSVHDNNFCRANNGGGVVFIVGSSGGNMEGPQVYGNTIYNNGRIHPTWGGNGGNADGIRMGSGAGFTISDPVIENNTIYGTTRVDAIARGIQIDADVTGGVARNNLLYNNQDDDIYDPTASFTLSNNACTAARNCGATNKVTITDIENCTLPPPDFRLKTGTNPCRDAGATTSTRPAPVGVTDIGAYEQGLAASAAVASTFIEVTMNIMTPSIIPASGITGWTMTCVGCTGSPSVTAATLKAGTTNVAQLTIAGLATSGSCTVSLGATNMTDSGYVGTTTTGTAQGVNTISGLSVSGTCANSSGGTAPTTPWVYYRLNEGNGNTLNDSSGNVQTGSTSGSPTWVTPVVDSYGLYFPNDGVDRRAYINYGVGANPTTQSFTICMSAKLDAGLSGKILFGPPNGTDQRLYVGTSSGQTWQLGVQGSSFSATGQSEFPVTTNITRICIGNDATADTVTLVVDGVMGTSAASRKTITSYVLAGNFLVGCGHLSISYCGGTTVDEIKVWTRMLSPSEFTDDYTSYVNPGGSIACYSQANHKFERVYLDGSSNPEAYMTAGATVEVEANGAVALLTQIDCTGSAGTAVALRPYYSTDGTNFILAIPQALGAANIATWGNSTDATLNRFTATCCISGALTANHGITVLDATASPTITLAQNHSYTIRIIVRIGDVAGQSFWIRWKQDNGAALAGGYTTTPRINVITPMASAGF